MGRCADGAQDSPHQIGVAHAAVKITHDNAHVCRVCRVCRAHCDAQYLGCRARVATDNIQRDFGIRKNKALDAGYRVGPFCTRTIGDSEARAGRSNGEAGAVAGIAGGIDAGAAIQTVVAGAAGQGVIAGSSGYCVIAGGGCGYRGEVVGSGANICVAGQPLSSITLDTQPAPRRGDNRHTSR